MAITFALIEPDLTLRAELLAIFERAPDFSCLAAYASAALALKKLPSPRPQVVLLDLLWKGRPTVRGIQELHLFAPALPILALAPVGDWDLTLPALAAGASGYLQWPLPAEHLLAALRDVLAGGSPMSSLAVRQLVRFLQNHRNIIGLDKFLSQREREVWQALANGFAYKQIADRLAMSLDTLRTHIRRIYAKLNVHSRGEAVARFFEPN